MAFAAPVLISIWPKMAVGALFIGALKSKAAAQKPKPPNSRKTFARRNSNKTPATG